MVDINDLKRALQDALDNWNHTDHGSPSVAFPATIFADLLNELTLNRDRIVAFEEQNEVLRGRVDEMKSDVRKWVGIAGFNTSKLGDIRELTERGHTASMMLDIREILDRTAD